MNYIYIYIQAHTGFFFLALPLVGGLSKNHGRMWDAYKDRKHSKSRINSVKNGEKDSQNKKAAMLEKRYAVMVTCVYFTILPYFELLYMSRERVWMQELQKTVA